VTDRLTPHLSPWFGALTRDSGFAAGSVPANAQRVKESPGGEAGARPKEKTSRGTLDAPILSQSMRRAIIRKRETRNQKD